MTNSTERELFTTNIHLNSKDNLIWATSTTLPNIGSSMKVISLMTTKKASAHSPYPTETPSQVNSRMILSTEVEPIFQLMVLNSRVNGSETY